MFNHSVTQRRVDLDFRKLSYLFKRLPLSLDNSNIFRYLDIPGHRMWKSQPIGAHNKEAYEQQQGNFNFSHRRNTR